MFNRKCISNSVFLCSVQTWSCHEPILCRVKCTSSFLVETVAVNEGWEHEFVVNCFERNENLAAWFQNEKSQSVLREKLRVKWSDMSFTHLCKVPATVLMLCRVDVINSICFSKVKKKLFLLFSFHIWCGFLCLKYYRAPRYRMRYVIIVLVERRCNGYKNKWSSLFENNVYLQRLNGITICVIFVYAMPPCWDQTLGTC